MGGINQALAADKLIRINDNEPLGLVQSFDWTPELGAQDIYEFGNQAKVDTSYELRTSGTMEMAAVGNTAGILARMIPVRTSATDAMTGYMYNSGGAGGKNAYTITEANIIETRFDLVQHERPDGVDFSRTTWLPRNSVSSISGSVRADGFASETIAFQGQDVVGFNKPYHDVRSIHATWTSATTATMADTAMTAHTLAYVYINDRRFRSAATSDATKFTMSTAGLLTVTTTEGYVIPQDADIHVLVYKTAPVTTFPAITTAQRGTTANYIRGTQVNIYLAPANSATPTDAEKFLRVQSIDFSIDMQLQELLEVGLSANGSPVYSRVPTLPLEISANCSIMETDWKDWSTMMTGKTNTDVYTSTYEFHASALKTNFALVVEYFTKASPAVRLQKWVFGDMAPAGRGTRTVVRGRGEVTWSFRGTKFSLQGFNA